MNKHNHFSLFLLILFIMMIFSFDVVHSKVPGQNRFDQIDINNDGKISASEFKGTKKLFNTIDSNNDGFLTKKEMLSFRLGKTTKTESAQTKTTKELKYIDTHAHLIANIKKRGKIDCDGAAQSALLEMNKNGVKKMILMPMPAEKVRKESLSCTDLTVLSKKHPDRFGVMLGGHILNPMIIESAETGKIDAALKKQFKIKAEEILSKGVLGFGEMAAEHFSMNPTHHYSSAPPNHPLFLLLADIAAEHNVPIDLHMEAIPQDMPLPMAMRRNSKNPLNLKSNIEQFEKLLEHNPKAKIVWQHTGWDNTGKWTPELCRRLLEKHVNLYFSFRVVKNVNIINRPLDKKGNLKETWVKLIQDYPDHFMFGCDEFFFPSYVTKEHGSRGSLESTVSFIEMLPKELQRKVGYENAMKVYGLQ